MKPTWVATFLLLYGASDADEYPFATNVVTYRPAPGQFVNRAELNDPAKALGAPDGWGTAAGNSSSVVTLGGFGGTLILSFDHTVRDDPLNPRGLDAIVFGNAFWSSQSGVPDPQVRFAEPATIEISLDDNGNRRADDPFYLIPGTHIAVPDMQRVELFWDDNIADDSFPPADEDWIPFGLSGTWSTVGFALDPVLFGGRTITNPLSGTDREGVYGYADFSPTLLLGDTNADNIVEQPSMSETVFYLLPDDPQKVGITSGAGGGDAFDIAWAVDAISGEPPHLCGFDFIRLRTAVHAVDAVFRTGERSAEIDAVSDVAPDPFADCDRDGDIDLADWSCAQLCYGTTSAEDGCEIMDRDANGAVDETDAAAATRRMTGPLPAPRECGFQ